MASEFQNFTEIDFEGIKESLVDYLKSKQEEGKLQGFEFEGSTMSMIMDLLAYNTQYNAFYLNQLASERFIGTAQKRSSLVNIAKNLGYLPRSAKPARSTLNVTLTPVIGHDGSLVIPANTKFTSKLEGKTLNFFTPQDFIIPKGFDGSYKGEITVLQGKLLSFTKQLSAEDRGIVIPNDRVDTDSIKVFVSDSPNVLGSEFTFSDKFSNILSDTTAFFLEEVDGERYRVFFGDGVVGAAVPVNKFIRIEYYITEGESGNGFKAFAVGDEIVNVESLRIDSAEQSLFGGDIESKDSIRVNAPRVFQRQNRAVTAEDYKSVVSQLFPNAVDVTSFGGEDLPVPAFGFVFVSILQQGGLLLSDTRKEELVSLLRERFSALSIRPVIVSPVPIYATVKTLVKYDSKRSNASVGRIKDSARASVFEFAKQNIQKFNSDLNFSRFVTFIDNSDQAITSNRTEIKFYLEFTDASQLSEIENVSIGQRIVPGSVVSNAFVFSGLLVKFSPNTENNEFLDLVAASSVGRVVVSEKVLQVDYNTGNVILVSDVSNFRAEFFEISETRPLKIFGETFSGDIEAKNNNVVLIRDSDVIVEAVDTVTNLTTGFVPFDTES